MTIRTLPILLGLALLGCPPPAPPDFRALAEKAYADGATPDRHAMDALWSALFKQPQWHFLMTAKSAAQKQPAVETIDGEQWLLVFTDLQMLRLYAVANKNVVSDGGAPNTVGTPAAPLADAGAAALVAAPPPALLADGGAQLSFAVAPPPPNPYLGADGSPLFLSLSAEQTKAFLAGYAGAPVSGIRFNEGSRKGWFASLKSVGNIREFLKANGKI